MIQILHYCITSNTSIQWNLPTNPTRLGLGQGREERERREKKRNDDDSDNDDKDDNDDDGIHSNYFVSAYKHS